MANGENGKRNMGGFRIRARKQNYKTGRRRRRREIRDFVPSLKKEKILILILVKSLEIKFLFLNQQ